MILLDTDVMVDYLRGFKPASKTASKKLVSAPKCWDKNPLILANPSALPLVAGQVCANALKP